MRRLLMLAPLAALAVVAPQSTAAATYTQPNWFVWNETKLDVVVVPPEHGQVFNGNGVLGGSEGGVGEATPFNSYLAALEEGMNDWKQAIQEFGSTALKTNVVINYYVVGRDTIPTAVLQDPEILVTTDENKTVILGVAVSSRPCIIANSKFFVTSFTYADMYNISAHEFGHCLGLDHSFGSPNDGTITHDVIYATYSDNPGSAGNHKHCMSNLNVAGLEQVFAPIGGVGFDVSMSPTSYRRISC